MTGGYLLDTHALLWWLTDDRQLSQAARDIIRDGTQTVAVSAASAWEIATKARLGRLDGMPNITAEIPELIVANGFVHLPVAFEHGVMVGTISHAHRDPFDRTIAAQGILESFAVITRDPAIAALGADVIW